MAAAAGPQVHVRSFGSRTDARLRGGDIDLLVEADQPVARAVRLEARVGGRLQHGLGDRRIDVLVAAPNVAEPSVHRVAWRTGTVP